MINPVDKNEDGCTIVTIADLAFVLPVFVLVLSLRFYEVKAKIRILSLGLTADQKAFFDQFQNVFVHESAWAFCGDATRKRAIVNICKEEAIRLAKHDDCSNIALLDADSIVTGDISEYLNPVEEGLFVRTRSASEDCQIFRASYENSDVLGTIPIKVLSAWKSDNDASGDSAIRNTSLSGNLVLNKKLMPFIVEWGELMRRVLPHSNKQFNHLAYGIMGDLTMSATLAFGKSKPKVFPTRTDSDPDAYIAHLGPSPKYWKIWPKEKLKYYESVLTLMEWAEQKGFEMPQRTWTMRRKNRPLVYATAYLYSAIQSTKGVIRKLSEFIYPNFRKRRRRY